MMTEPPTGYRSRNDKDSIRRRATQNAGLATIIAILITVSIPRCAAQERPAAQALTLQQAVQQALAKNPQLESAEDMAKAAEARTDEAKAAWFPRVDLSEGFTRGNNPVYVFGTLLEQQSFTAANFDLGRLNTPTPLNNFQTRVDGQMLLFDSGQTRNRVRGAKQSKTAADFQKEQARQDLILRVIEAYYGVVVARGNAAAATAALQAAEANEHRAETMQKAGLIVDSDLLSAKVFTAQMKDREIRAENGVELARLTLGREMGLEPGTQPDATEALKEPAAPVKSVEDWEKTALEQRPMLQAAEMGREASESERKSARAEFGPKIGVFADVERDSLSFAGNGGSNWTAGAQVKFNLFAGGAEKARLNEAQANENKAKHDLEWVKSGVLLEVQQAYLGIAAAEQRTAAARDTAGQAQESLRIIQNRYQAGLTTITELLRAQTSQLDARTAYFSAVYDWHTAQAELEHSAGTLTPDAALLQGEKQP
ncbi:MAG TPA: TolC family protein [Terriglobales bacterium]|nr:TolC family protein [Terriglobales bacterium]